MSRIEFHNKRTIYPLCICSVFESSFHEIVWHSFCSILFTGWTHRCWCIWRIYTTLVVVMGSHLSGYSRTHPSLLIPANSLQMAKLSNSSWFSICGLLMLPVLQFKDPLCTCLFGSGSIMSLNRNFTLSLWQDVDGTVLVLAESTPPYTPFSLPSLNSPLGETNLKYKGKFIVKIRKIASFGVSIRKLKYYIFIEIV